MSEECRKCRFWKERGTQGIGTCRRYAPRPILAIENEKYTVAMHSAWAALKQVGVDMDELGIPVESELSINSQRADWPISDYDDWCGDFVKAA